MPMIIDENGKRISSNATSRLIRPNYQYETILTIAEAAHIAERSTATIYRWIREKQFPLARRVGGPCIPNDIFLNFLKTGEKQRGPVPVK